MERSFRLASRVAVWNLLINAMLAALKLMTGFFSHSSALLSDGMHSVTDVFSTLAVLIGLRFSAAGENETHPYGCERLECVAAIVLSSLVAVTGAGIALASLKMLVSMSQPSSVTMDYAWITAVASILVKEVMFRYTKRAAVRCGSTALMADAWHQRTDALSSVGSLVGVIGAGLGVWWLDALAGLFIALLILKAALEIFADAMRKMTDRACDEGLQADIRTCADQVEAVQSVKQLRTRLFGNRVIAEITVCVAKGMTAKEAYEVAQAVKTAVESECEAVKSCSVHIHPSEIPLAPLQNE